MAQQAQDTFVADLDDGSTTLVTRGEVLPDSHELVKRDQAGGGSLFRKLNIDGGEEPVIKARVPHQPPAPEPPRPAAPTAPKVAPRTAAKGKA